MTKTGPKPKNPEDRFWTFVKVGEKCWEWIGSKNRGYGQLSAGWNKNPIKAHRFSYELSYGPIPTGMQILHQCDNPGCVRPDHMRLGTWSENMRDMVQKGRNGQRKLTDEDAYAILWREASGEYVKKLAEEYGVSLHTVRMIAKRRTYLSLSVSHD